MNGILYNESFVFFSLGNTHQALLKLKELLDLSPDFAEAYKLAGDIKARRGLFKEAVVNYERAWELGVKNGDLYNDLGICYMRIENYPAAVKYLNEAYQLEPFNADIIYNLASTLRDNEQFDEALLRYRELVSLKYDYPNAHNDLAIVYELIGKREEAEAEYQNEIRVIRAKFHNQPEDISTLTALSVAYNGLRQYHQAKEIIDKVIKENPDYGKALYTRAVIYANLGEPQKAMEDLEKAKEFFPFGGFLDNYIIELRKGGDSLTNRESFFSDTVIHLDNGRIMKGKFLRETKDKVYLEKMIGSSIVIIGIPREEIKLTESLSLRLK